MSEQVLRFETLTPGAVMAYAREILSVAADQPEEYWELEHFLVDLPQKWVLSFAVFLSDELAGYAVLSRRDIVTIHLHHFMLRKDVRGSGFGTGTMGEVERRARAVGASALSLKYRADNMRVRQFYERCGFRQAGPEAVYRVMTKQLT